MNRQSQTSYLEKVLLLSTLDFLLAHPCASSFTATIKLRLLEKFNQINAFSKRKKKKHQKKMRRLHEMKSNKNIFVQNVESKMYIYSTSNKIIVFMLRYRYVLLFCHFVVGTVSSQKKKYMGTFLNQNIKPLKAHMTRLQIINPKNIHSKKSSFSVFARMMGDITLLTVYMADSSESLQYCICWLGALNVILL